MKSVRARQRSSSKQAPGKSCTGGKFGDRCQFQCHCAANTDCDQSNGACSDGCDPQWFGPACQYDVSEFSISGGSGSDMSWLTDNDDETCNNGNVQPITVRLHTPHPLSWLRVVFRDTAYLDQFQLSYQIDGSLISIPCVNPRTARVGDLTLDIFCPTSDVISHVILSGSALLRLCSLYISGGRNVAFNQATQHSTTFDTNWFAYKAVDGNPGLEVSPKATCSHTALKQLGFAWWRMTFSNYVEINRFVIYNRRDCCEDRLINFTVKAYSSPGTNPVYSYTDPGGPAQLVYTVVPSPPIAFSVKSVQFDVSKNIDGPNILTLCEVYAFGEIVCPAGKFGRQCERDCNCADRTEACFVSTGGCPTGCAAGYTGEDCHTQCSPGMYGRDCDRTCSDRCAGDGNLCNFVNGTCTQGCDAGYLMPLCEDKCPITKFGQGCKGTCNTNCLNRECHHVTGECNDCPKGYTGVFCEEECPHATYGSGCNQNCSDNCVDQACHHINGECIECTDTWTGVFCDTEASQNEKGKDGSNAREGSSIGEVGGSGSAMLVPAIVGAVVAAAVIAAVAVVAAVVASIVFCRRPNVSDNHERVKRHNSEGGNGRNTYVTDFDHHDSQPDLAGSSGPHERSLSSTGSERPLKTINRESMKVPVGQANNIAFRRTYIQPLPSHHNERPPTLLDTSGHGASNEHIYETISDYDERPNEPTGNTGPYESPLPFRRNTVAFDNSIYISQNKQATTGPGKRQDPPYQNIKPDEESIMVESSHLTRTETAQQKKDTQNRAKQTKMEMSRVEKSREVQNKTNQNGDEQSRKEQRSTEQNQAMQEGAEQNIRRAGRS
ncbi:multiple epidermal growth factor-like domains protein 10 [Plakobranchus ocellatus]|uniref:Multiple epidermal growth factor-like domains protein 10 n=1 Tax=Plakobranchus ocellatus TaxID=259542 RepID=A0AAV4BX89_9GAST|nr:multiple epidermal growth factor-like domains protein 10 [Plakobranchus ocellatus]